MQSLSEFFETHEWTKKANARDADGAEVSLNSPTACCWCVYGAADRLGFDTQACNRLSFAVKDKHNMLIVEWNDSRESKAQLISQLKEMGY